MVMWRPVTAAVMGMRRGFSLALSRNKHRPVGAHEHRKAAIAVYQTKRHRGLAMLVRSYRKVFQIRLLCFFDMTQRFFQTQRCRATNTDL